MAKKAYGAPPTLESSWKSTPGDLALTQEGCAASVPEFQTSLYKMPLETCIKTLQPKQLFKSEGPQMRLDGRTQWRACVTWDPAEGQQPGSGLQLYEPPVRPQEGTLSQPGHQVRSQRH